MFWKSKAPAFSEISPRELQALMAQGKALLVDVREPAEFAAGRIPGAVNLPLSRFRPDAVPVEPGRETVLSCAAGSRSAAALAACAEAGSAIRTHLKGGLAGWKAAGLPVEA